MTPSKRTNPLAKAGFNLLLSLVGERPIHPNRNFSCDTTSQIRFVKLKFEQEKPPGSCVTKADDEVLDHQEDGDPEGTGNVKAGNFYILSDLDPLRVPAQPLMEHTVEGSGVVPV